MFRLLKSKKGFTLTEIIVCVTLLGILVVVAVPVYISVEKKARLNECASQRQVISTAVQEAMMGMLDNGKKQPVINFDLADSAHVSTYSANDVSGDADDEYDGKKCFVLKEDDTCFTLGDLRGGYRNVSTNPEYRDGIKNEGKYLKKQRLADVPFYQYLGNMEVPVCPFAEHDDTEYLYYIFEDGSVLCDCPKCLEVD